jgi:hypothetical protein
VVPPLVSPPEVGADVDVELDVASAVVLDVEAADEVKVVVDVAAVVDPVLLPSSFESAGGADRHPAIARTAKYTTLEAAHRRTSAVYRDVRLDPIVD